MTNSYQPHDLFMNVDTNEVETYYNLTTWESDSDTMLNMTDEEFEEKQRDQMNYFNELLNNGTYVQVYEVE